MRAWRRPVWVDLVGRIRGRGRGGHGGRSVAVRRVIVDGLRGALLLARFRAEGLALIEATPEGALRSLWALAILPPLVVGASILDLLIEGRPVGETAVGAVATLLEQTVGWLGGGLAMRPVAAALGRADRWPHVFAASNWTLAIVPAAMTLLAVPLLAISLLTGDVAPVPIGMVLGQAVVVAALGCYFLCVLWFVARVALHIGGMAAVVVVLIELGVATGLPWLLHRIAGA
jgi:hypothetical protein